MDLGNQSVGTNLLSEIFLRFGPPDREGMKQGYWLLMMRIYNVLLLLLFVNTGVTQSTSGYEEAPREYWLAIAYANGIGS